MPVYSYKGVSDGGKSVKGTVSAENMRAARSRMRVDGVFLTQIKESKNSAESTNDASASRFRFELPTRIPPLHLAVATRQLATLSSAGIPLVECLTALVEQIEHSTLKGVFAQIRDRVNEGSALADAIASTEKFDSLYTSMVRSGEASGALGPVLVRVADYLEEQVRLSSKLISIFVYPAVLLGFSLLVVAMLVTVVLPQITNLLLSMGQELPFYTRVVIGAADFARSWWWAMLGAVLLMVIAFRAYRRTENGRVAVDKVMLRLPLLGRVIRVVAIARFTRTLSSLLAAGVGIIQALDISRHVARNAVIEEAINNARSSVLEGASLAYPLRASGEFPPMVITMVEVGERAGDLEAMLAKVAETYDEQVETTVTRLTSLLEPLLILVMVGIVLFIMMATLMPLMSVTSSLQ
ncbi:MAG TPA: type II secretion system protein GspF [Myxococcales bacterium]|nr:type II secretion system protein GspF [Myxococcales bacterium]HIL02095.1 type II secretion system protein GspF [Myxococcales bacterium]